MDNLTDRVALVTGASRGIGESIAETLHRDGAKLVLLDVPQLSEDLQKVAKRLDADTIEIDITDEKAPKAIADKLEKGVDVVVHNAGVTRDRTIAKMPEDRWSSLMEINLSSEERINDALLDGVEDVAAGAPASPPVWGVVVQAAVSRTAQPTTARRVGKVLFIENPLQGPRHSSVPGGGSWDVPTQQSRRTRVNL